jgi:ABC-type spermidine/putrescine transport system permease subunit I
MKSIKAFLYFFVLFGVLGLTNTFVRESKVFDKPLSALDSMDVSSVIMAILIQLICLFLIYDTSYRFKELSRVKRSALILFAILISTVYFLFLIGIFIE